MKHPRDPFRVRSMPGVGYATSMGSSPDVARCAEEHEAPARRLEPCRAIMGYDPDRAERDRSVW